MDVLIDQQRYEFLYNCSRYPIDTVPIEIRRKVVYGIVLLVLSIIFTFSNMLCARAFCKFLHYSAYKILFIIGLNDAISLIIFAIYGIFLIQGAEFCSVPLLQYLLGMICQFCWSQTTVLQLLLAIERCLCQIWPQFAKSLFSGARILPWLLLVLIYSVYYGFFNTPAVISSTIGTMVLDPFMAYRSANEFRGEIRKLFKNDLDRLHEFVIAAALPSIYVFYGILLSIKWGQIESQPSDQQIKMRKSVGKKIFIQIFTVSILDFSGCALISAVYLIRMPYIISSLIILFSTLICGLPSVIYLVFNKTLRTESLRLLGWNKIQPISDTIKNAWS